eukprot:137858-Chlamydomonas_euryale.AAC.1
MPFPPKAPRITVAVNVTRWLACRVANAPHSLTPHLHRVPPQAVGHGAPHLQRLLRHTLALFGAQHVHAPHVVQTVGQLYKDDQRLLKR